MIEFLIMYVFAAVGLNVELSFLTKMDLVTVSLVNELYIDILYIIYEGKGRGGEQDRGEHAGAGEGSRRGRNGRRKIIKIPGFMYFVMNPGVF